MRGKLSATDYDRLAPTRCDETAAVDQLVLLPMCFPITIFGKQCGYLIQLTC
jgi:hypothetical protein